MEARVLVVKYELYYEDQLERVGKADRVTVSCFGDAEEDAAIAFREAVHERRCVRDLAHCSAANLRVFAESSSAPFDAEEELTDDDFLRHVVEGRSEKLRVLAPPLLKALPSARSRSVGSVSRSTDFPLQGASQERELTLLASALPSRRDSASAPKRSDPDSMVVFVKTGDAAFPIEVQKNASVDNVRARLTEQEQIPLEQQRLIYGGVELDGQRCLWEYNIHEGSEIQLMLNLGSSGTS